MTQARREPFFGDIPAIVLILIAVIALLSALVILGPVALGNTVLGLCAVQIGAAPWPQPLGPLPPFALHVFVHGGWVHLVVNLVGLLTFGPPVARWLQSGRSPARAAGMFLVLFFAAAFAGALAQTAAVMLSGAPGTALVGASDGLMGLIGVLVRLDYGRAARPLALTSRRVLTALAPWVILNALSGFIVPPGVSGVVAWQAHLGGLFAGLVLAGLIAPKR